MGAPSLLDGQAAKVLGMLNEYGEYLMNRVDQGGIVVDNGSAQGAGAGGDLTLTVDWDAILANVDGVFAALAAGSAQDLYDAAFAWGAETGKTCIAAIVLETGSDNDTPAVDVVFGAVADDGSEVAPIDHEIDTGIGHSNWIRLTDMTIQRTGATALTLTPDQTVRPSVSGFRGDLATTESDYRI